ncbi:MAG: hypothetical protein K2Y23_06940 [Cyanobacteria bacterium]|nr:hypothetical protein [Cyanobacteriota bacterium]
MVTRQSTACQAAALGLQLLRYREEVLATSRYSDPKRLLRHGFKIYSQNDEDGIIQEVLSRVGAASRTFVEIGVGRGNECNSAKLLVEGWRGIWIERDAVAGAAIRRDFETFLTAGDLVLIEAAVTADNVNGLLAPHQLVELDILSIDIDNNDYWIWKAIEVVKPRVVVIEYNASFPPPMSVVVPYEPERRWTGGNYFGASLEALVRLGAAKGYSIVGCGFAGVNAFFVRDDCCGDRFKTPATAQEHYEPSRYFVKHLPAGHHGRPGRFQVV